jgi:hypothetical protein
MSGPIEFTIYLSSDAKDTDCHGEVIDVYPGRHAYNLTRRSSACAIATATTSR